MYPINVANAQGLIIQTIQAEQVTKDRQASD